MASLAATREVRRPAGWESLADVGLLPNVRCAPIVLKNSKIAGLRKSRKCSALAISASARRCRIDTRASDGFCGNSCGPHLAAKATHLRS
jgi:hypothetical protein